MKGPQPRDAIKSLLSYRPSFGKVEQGSVIRLSANEGALGTSPKVLAHLKADQGSPSRYPEVQDRRLCEAIASRYTLEPGQILTANGSDELLSLIAMAYLEAGDEAIHTQYAFLVIPQVIQIAGATPVVAQDKDFICDVDAILAAVTARTKVVFLVNPNNPTSTIIPMDEVQRLHAGLRRDILLVLDWAYAEYQPDSFSDEAARMVEAHDNIIMTRTFSKLHGLAAFRLGWAYCAPDILTTLGSIRGPFSVNQIAADAGIIAVGDVEFQEKSLRHSQKWMDEMCRFFTSAGLSVVPSATNFILIGFDGHNGPTASETARYLASKNILFREMAPYGLDQYLRMSIGTDEEMQIVKQTLSDFFAGAQKSGTLK